MLVATLGLAAWVHVPPEACSISVLRVPLAAVWKPTAHAVPSAKVSTPTNSESLVSGAGEFTDHAVPFQCNASGWYVPDGCE